MILGFLAVFSGYLNAPGAPFETEYFLEWVEPRGVEVGAESAADEEGIVDEGLLEEATGTFGRSGPAVVPFPGADEGGDKKSGCGFEPASEGVCFAPKVPHAEFKWSKAAISIGLVLFGIAIAAWISLGVFGDRKHPLKGLTERNRLAGAGHRFLVNKYYLDDLYEKIIVRGVAHPIAKGAYWINQKVIDGIVDGAGRSGKRTGEWVYRNIDQRVVDGAVDASGLVASESGHALQPVQSGKVNQYGALLFGAAAVGAIVLIILNV